jgi:ABC-2 type transport system permease protein
MSAAVQSPLLSPALWWMELGRRLHERKTKGLAVLYLGALLAAPTLLEKPPPHLLAAVQSWFGGDDPFGLFMYVWTDLAMNKLAVLTGVAMGAGVLVEDRADRSLILWMTKPVTPAGLYVLRVGSAVLMTAALYLITQLLGLGLFSAQIDGFRPLGFLISGLVHVWAPIFATCASALCAVAIGRQLGAALVSVLVLFSLVGGAFLGVYNPAWADVLALNPFTQAVAGVTFLQSQSVSTLGGPVLGLIGLNLALVTIGARLARRIEP